MNVHARQYHQEAKQIMQVGDTKTRAMYILWNSYTWGKANFTSCWHKMKCMLNKIYEAEKLFEPVTESKTYMLTGHVEMQNNWDACDNVLFSPFTLLLKAWLVWGH